jgi:ATP-dependent helicase/nuclease subunit A
VHYKLDRGVDHVLIDEAQDTSPRQWDIVDRIIAEFTSGEGARDGVKRTIFAVGDEKQSIFSFQGAVPAWFARMARELGMQARAAGYPWEGPELHLSFRSVPKVLDAVDAVFASPAVHAGLTAEPRPTLHTARRRNEPGRVVVWPRYEAPAKSEASDWVLPLDHLGEDSPEVKLARRIAITVRGWLDRGEVLDAPGADGAPRPIRPGGILILVRSRGALTDAINRELKTHGVPIAGSDRIAITEHIAVMDLMAAGRVALLPEDDLSLAAVLKSPLIGLDEDALFALAHGRSGSLWAALNEKAAAREDFAGALRIVEGWREVADTIDPHAFFARILGPGHGRKAFLRRLGPEADDVLDEFIAQALAYEQANAPSLEGFLHWLTAAEMEVRRDTDTLRDEVRVMTVHGAKGLEADVVFLVDNGTPPTIPGHDRKVLPLADDADPAAPGPVVWMRSVKAMPEAVRARVEAERERDREEYRRLLYVGMTRARDRLYVVGIVKQKRTEDTRWHPLIVEALEGDLVESVSPDGEPALEWRPEPPAPPVSTDAVSVSATPSPPLPTWITAPVTGIVTPARRITPSAVAAPAPARQAAVRAALHRGRIVHRLLESLPEIPAENRHSVGSAYLSAFAGESLDSAEQAALLARVLAILDDPEFSAVFSEGSRAEVEIAGNIKGLVISGRIDRLAVSADRVLIVDYKTNRPAPENISAVPPAYVTQLSLYRLVLSRLYPQHRIAAALLWTEVPRLMEVPEDMLLAAQSALSVE